MKPILSAARNSLSREKRSIQLALNMLPSKVPLELVETLANIAVHLRRTT